MRQVPCVHVHNHSKWQTEFKPGWVWLQNQCFKLVNSWYSFPDRIRKLQTTETMAWPASFSQLAAHFPSWSWIHGLSLHRHGSVQEGNRWGHGPHHVRPLYLGSISWEIIPALTNEFFIEQMRIPDNGGLPNEESFFLKLRLLSSILKAIIIKFQNQSIF